MSLIIACIFSPTSYIFPKFGDRGAKYPLAICQYSYIYSFPLSIWDLYHLPKSARNVRRCLTLSKFSETRNDLFMKFIDYRTACNLWNIGYEMNLTYFDRFCTEHFPLDKGITQGMINGWCEQRDTENKTSLIGRTLSARKLIEYLNERGLVNLTIPEMPTLPPKQHGSLSRSVISHAFAFKRRMW